MALTNTLAYYVAELIEYIKGFVITHKHSQTNTKTI